MSEGPPAVDDVRELLQVPADLAKALERHLVLAIDEGEEQARAERERESQRLRARALEVLEAVTAQADALPSNSTTARVRSPRSQSA